MIDPFTEPRLRLYHWSPRERRGGIERNGLQIGKPTLSGDWRPPFVCLALDPVIAWDLVTDSARGLKFPKQWDLWSAVKGDLDGTIECLFDHYTFSDELYVAEVRVYERIPKGALSWVGERSFDATVGRKATVQRRRSEARKGRHRSDRSNDR